LLELLARVSTGQATELELHLETHLLVIVVEQEQVEAFLMLGDLVKNQTLVLTIVVALVVLVEGVVMKMEVVHWRNLFLVCQERIIPYMLKFLIHLSPVMVKLKEDIMQIQKENVKYFTFVEVMVMED